MIDQQPFVLGISGPDGAGKGYLTEQAVKILGEAGIEIVELQMISTRAPRDGERSYNSLNQLNETTGMAGGKRCVSDELFDELLEAGRLIGDHQNTNGFRYAYLKDDFDRLDLGSIAIVELNPVFQREIGIKLQETGIRFGWLGLTAKTDYLKTNIQNRQPSISEEELTKKLRMADEIILHLQNLEGRGLLVSFPVGWNNRETMGTDFAERVKQMAQEG